MGEDIIQRLFDKIDDIKDEMSDLKVEVGKIKTKLEENEKTEVVREKGGKEQKGLIAWAITTAIALYGAFHGGH